MIGENGLLKQLTKALVERALNAELTHHLGYEKNDAGGRGSGNSRNGASRKPLTGDLGEIEIEVPRDRVGEFEPKIVGKHQRRFTGFDDKILSMYARGMSTREILGHLQEIYGAEVSPTLISGVTDAVPTTAYITERKSGLRRGKRSAQKANSKHFTYTKLWISPTSHAKKSESCA